MAPTSHGDGDGDGVNGDGDVLLPSWVLTVNVMHSDVGRRNRWV